MLPVSSKIAIDYCYSQKDFAAEEENNNNNTWLESFGLRFVSALRPPAPLQDLVGQLHIIQSLEEHPRRICRCQRPEMQYSFV